MRRLIESALVSLDGVIEAPEQWANFDAEDAAYSMEQLGHYDAFIMGRVTYEKLYANFAPVVDNPYIGLINAMPKYVASRTLTESRMECHAPRFRPIERIARLKDQPGKDLINTAPAASTTRSCETAWSMVPVVDQARCGRSRPTVVRGRGHLRLHLRLTDEKRLENGSVILTYVPR